MAKDCDRACTVQIAGAVLAALQSGQIEKRLPRSTRLTENGRDIHLADSQLRAFKKVNYLNAFAEQAGGVAGFNGAAEAYGGAAVFSVRLKLKADQIAEVETLVVRRSEAMTFLPQTMAGKADGDQVLSLEGRTPRVDLIALSNAWLDSLAQGHAAGSIFASDCDLTENGARFTSCRNVAGLRGVNLIRDRRWPLIDDARGLVWVFAVADIPDTGGAAPGSSASHTFRREPRSVRVAALFRVEGGQITAIELVLRDASPGAMSGWTPPKTKKGSAGTSLPVD